ncbi:hypothetical protein BKA56DRAFT_610539 [Ilyonectria sp. MPI-CAGE-AT-0026]|nr:hypothetical protein BKA56DRAFT_610539 [Ilyonectria sp. MPI-CAGE-AT-0026]
MPPIGSSMTREPRDAVLPVEPEWRALEPALESLLGAVGQPTVATEGASSRAARAKEPRVQAGASWEAVIGGGAASRPGYGGPRRRPERPPAPRGHPGGQWRPYYVVDGGDDDVVHSVITGRGGDAPFWLRAMVMMATLTLTSKQPSNQASEILVDAGSFLRRGGRAQCCRTLQCLAAWHGSSIDLLRWNRSASAIRCDGKLHQDARYSGS